MGVPVLYSLKYMFKSTISTAKQTCFKIYAKRQDIINFNNSRLNDKFIPVGSRLPCTVVWLLYDEIFAQAQYNYLQSKGLAVQKDW